MPGPFDALIPLLAQAPAANPQPSILTTFLPFLPVLIIFYFLMIRPQQQQERKRREMIGAMKKNDKVLTAAGIYGTVMSIDADADKVVLRVDDERGVKLAFSRASIVRVLDGPEKDKDKDKAAETA